MKTNLIALLLTVLLAGCITPTPGPGEPSGTPTFAVPETPETPEATASATPTLPPEGGETPTGEATPTPIVTAGPDEPPPVDARTLPNLLDNPGFEAPHVSGLVERGEVQIEHTVAQGWRAFYCDVPYWPEPCDAPLLGEGNPIDLLMGRPEYKPTALPDRVYSGGLAQQWFCFFRACDAGVYQDFPTVPGEDYLVGAYVQSWYNTDDDPESDIETDDDAAGSVWWIRIDPLARGRNYAFDPQDTTTCVFTSLPFDAYVEIRCLFVAESTRATVYFGNQRAWPIRNNDNYIDQAFAACVTCEGAVPEPEPTPEPTPAAPTPVIPIDFQRPPNADVNVAQLAGVAFPFQTLATFAEHVVDWDATVREDVAAGDPVPVVALYIDPITREHWLALDGGWRPNPDGFDVMIWQASEWLPWAVWLDTYNATSPHEFTWLAWFQGELPTVPVE